jgi:hypothetical protein
MPIFAGYDRPDPARLFAAIYYYANNNPFTTYDIFGLEECGNVKIISLNILPYELHLSGNCPPENNVREAIDKKIKDTKDFQLECSNKGDKCVNLKDYYGNKQLKKNYSYSFCFDWLPPRERPCKPGEKPCNVSFLLTVNAVVKGKIGECKCSE